MCVLLFCQRMPGNFSSATHMSEGLSRSAQVRLNRARSTSSMCVCVCIVSGGEMRSPHAIVCSHGRMDVVVRRVLAHECTEYRSVLIILWVCYWIRIGYLFGFYFLFYCSCVGRWWRRTETSSHALPHPGALPNSNAQDNTSKPMANCTISSMRKYKN